MTARRVTVLGCSGAITLGQYTTSFLIDDDLLVDAGTGLGQLTLDQMSAIDHVVLTHSHLDHIAGLPLMLDSVGSRRPAPLRVQGLGTTLEALRAHVFNDLIWPDFTQIPKDRPFLELQPLTIGQQLELGRHTLRVLPARHSVPAVGYAVATSKGWWVYTGDTSGCPEFWDAIRDLPLAMLVIETAFVDEEAQLAHIAHHLTPATLKQQLAHLGPANAHVPVGIMHNKPADAPRIREQATVALQGLPNPVVWLESGMVLTF